MVDGAPPLKLKLQILGGVSRAPRPAGQAGEGPADRHTCPGGRCQGIESFNEGGLDPAGKAMRDQSLAEGFRLTQQHMAADISDAVPAVTFDDLSIDAEGGCVSTDQVRRRELAACTQAPKWAVRA